jgi:hypothetical protein
MIIGKRENRNYEMMMKNGEEDLVLQCSFRNREICLEKIADNK